MIIFVGFEGKLKFCASFFFLCKSDLPELLIGSGSMLICIVFPSTKDNVKCFFVFFNFLFIARPANVFLVSLISKYGCIHVSNFHEVSADS